MEKKNIIIYSLTGLLLLSIVFCIGSFLYSAVERLTSGNIEEKTRIYKQELAKDSKYETLYKHWKNIDSEFEKFKSEYLMNLDDFSLFRTELNNLFNKYQLRNNTMQVRYKALYKDILMAEVIFGVKGSYPSIKQFTNELLSYQKLSVLKGMEISRDKRTEEIIGSFTMEVYIVR